MKRNVQEAKRRIDKIRGIMSRAHLPSRKTAKQEIIEEIRKTREKLWEDKFAAHS